MSTRAADLLAGYPLRERKRARLRVGLWSALRDRIERMPFAEITVRQLAADLEISEPTFFAHFATKTELLAYHICLWRIDTVHAASRAGEGIGFLRGFFDQTARSIQAGPRLWYEITAEVARGGGVCTQIEISPAERLLAFGDPAMLRVHGAPQPELFEQHLTKAKAAGEYPGRVPDAVTSLLTGFYGVPLALGRDRLDELPAAYRRQLDHVLTECR